MQKFAYSDVLIWPMLSAGLVVAWTKPANYWNTSVDQYVPSAVPSDLEADILEKSSLSPLRILFAGRFHGVLILSLVQGTYRPCAVSSINVAL